MLNKNKTADITIHYPKKFDKQVSTAICHLMLELEKVEENSGYGITDAFDVLSDDNQFNNRCDYLRIVLDDIAKEAEGKFDGDYNQLTKELRELIQAFFEKKGVPNKWKNHKEKLAWEKTNKEP